MMKDIETRILFEKDGLLVIDKPYNIPSTGHSLEDSDCVQFWLMKRQGGMVWAIHQLDADTTGVNIFVTKKELVPIYKEALELNNSTKEYLAITHGTPSWNEHDEFSPIGSIGENSLGVHPNGKPAHSKFTVLDRNKKYSLIRVNIYSGRTHQIRIHLSHIGHPLVGEEWYKNPACKQHFRQALHCHKIMLNQKGEVFTSPIPNDLKILFRNLMLNM
jgi:23S rRNA-/tRNA-specific pseudouridylate synthase